MPALKYSRQREAIKSFLMTRKDHPTADVVYHSLRADLGTVWITSMLIPAVIITLSARNAAAFSTCTPNFRIPSILFTRHWWMETGSMDMQCIFRGSATAV